MDTTGTDAAITTDARHHHAAHDFRALAAAWHGGATSALYAYASTGTVIDGLTDEVADALAIAERGDNNHWQDAPALQAMADALARGELGRDACRRHALAGCEACAR